MTNARFGRRTGLRSFRFACLAFLHARSSRAGIRQNAASAAGFRLRLGGGTFRSGCVALFSSLRLHSTFPARQPQTEALCLKPWDVELNGNFAPVYARAVKLQAYVFCDCYQRSRLKHPPPNPEIIAVLPNGDLGYSRATRKQHTDFVAWRSHACRHPEGVVTGGELGHKLSRKVLHRAMSPHKRAFPLFVQKILGCKPHTRDSHLTTKQVGKLQSELVRLKDFSLPEPKLDLELRWYYGQVKQLVRAAMKFRKPIAL